jgi:hypothetical protein
MGLYARGLFALCLLPLLLPAAWAAVGGEGQPQAMARLRVEPAYIPIGMTYSGASVQVDVEIPAGYEVAIRLMGRTERLELKRKDKVGRLLWMSVGEVAFEEVPVVYWLLTSTPLAQLAPGAILAERKLGYDALAGAAGPAAQWFPELIKLREKEGRFGVREGQLVRSGGGTAERLTGAFRLPALVPAGEYTVDLFGFSGGRARHLGSRTVRLEYAGIAMVVRSVATEHGLIYGGVAVVLAVLAGLITGFVFQPKKGKGK